MYLSTDSHAIGRTITIRAVSIHTNKLVIDEPTGVSFNSSGEITFTAGDNNVAADRMSYSYTLFNGGASVTGFIDQAITSGTAPSGIEAKMLESPGVYIERRRYDQK